MNKGTSAATSANNLLKNKGDQSAIEVLTIATRIVTLKTDTVVEQDLMDFFAVKRNTNSAVEKK